MTRDEAREAAKVMLAWVDGEEIECSSIGGSYFTLVRPNDSPRFDFGSFQYRIKPKPLEVWHAVRKCDDKVSDNVYYSKEGCEDSINKEWRAVRFVEAPNE